MAQMKLWLTLISKPWLFFMVSTSFNFCVKAILGTKVSVFLTTFIPDPDTKLSDTYFVLFCVSIQQFKKTAGNAKLWSLHLHFMSTQVETAVQDTGIMIQQKLRDGVIFYKKKYYRGFFYQN